jgi:hypothetical protein
MGYIEDMGAGDVIGDDALSSILILESRSDRGKLEKGSLTFVIWSTAVSYETFEMERQLASLDLTHVICKSRSKLARKPLTFSQMTQIHTCLLG